MLSELRKRTPAQPVAEWFAGTRADGLYISVLVVGEIRQGVERLRGRDPSQAVVFERWLDGLGREFADRVLPVDLAVAQTWGRVSAVAPLPVVDALLAATALVHGLTLVTRDDGMLRESGVSVLNPWL